MKKAKQLLRLIFVDGLTGMATGLFATLIIGTIMQQIGNLLPSGWTVGGVGVGHLIWLIGKVAMVLTGAGIGMGVATKLKTTPLTVLSAMAAGLIGSFASKLIDGSILSETALHIVGVGEPLGAFLAALAAVGTGKLVAGNTRVDILLTPLCCILAGSAVGLVAGPPISEFMVKLGALVNWGVEQQPLAMGIVVSVLMGIFLTLPISSAAIGVILQLSGAAAGAATVGCCCNMIGFAVASYRENKMGGLLAQGLGTSMLQMPNIVRHPAIWLPAILSSAVLGPVGIVLLGITGNATGSGMGTAGLVGPLMSWQTMTETLTPGDTLWRIALGLIILPALVSLLFSEVLRKLGWINAGDMKLEL